MDHYFAKTNEDEGVVKVKDWFTRDMKADILTKALGPNKCYDMKKELISSHSSLHHPGVE